MRRRESVLSHLVWKDQQAVYVLQIHTMFASSKSVRRQTCLSRGISVHGLCIYQIAMSLYFSECFFFVFLKARCLCISLDSRWARSSDQGFDDFPVKKHSGHQRCEFTQDRQLLANLLKNCLQKLLYKISPQIGSKWSSAPEQQQNLNDNHSEYSFHSSQRFRLNLILLTLFAPAYLSISSWVGNRVPNLFM